MTNDQDPNQVPEYGTPEYERWYAEHFPEQYAASRDPAFQNSVPQASPRKKHHRVRNSIVGTFAGIVALIVIIDVASGGNGGKDKASTDLKPKPVAATSAPAATQHAKPKCLSNGTPDGGSTDPSDVEYCQEHPGKPDHNGAKVAEGPKSTAEKTPSQPAPSKSASPKPTQSKKVAPRPAPVKSAAPKPAPTKSAAPKPAPPKPAPPKPKYATFGDGQFQIGKDIPAGTYRAPDAGPGCYWERVKDFSGNLDSILDNDNAPGPAIVTILPTDAGFTSEGCGEWTSNLGRITPSADSFGDGTWQVGIDIHAGTYRAPNAGSCYWERESSFGAGLDSIIANDNPVGPAVVTISPTDKGFKSSDCGTWTRIQ